MSTPPARLLCSYAYDPLDRLTGHSLQGQAGQRFYQKKRLVTEIQGRTRLSVFQYDDYLLAQRKQDTDGVDNQLLAVDGQRSVLHSLGPGAHQATKYLPYGYSLENALLGFNGERPEPATGHYLLGMGYRAFNPMLMRFNSPDSLSPFGSGGLNAYAYCQGDPINRSDPTGHFPMWPRSNGLIRPPAIIPRRPPPRVPIMETPPPLPPRDTAPPLPPRNTAPPLPPRSERRTPSNSDWPPGAVQTGTNTLAVPVPGDPDSMMFYSISERAWTTPQNAAPSASRRRHIQLSPSSSQSDTGRLPINRVRQISGSDMDQPPSYNELPPSYDEALTKLSPSDPYYQTSLRTRVSEQLESIRKN